MCVYEGGGGGGGRWPLSPSERRFRNPCLLSPPPRCQHRTPISDINCLFPSTCRPISPLDTFPARTAALHPTPGLPAFFPISGNVNSTFAVTQTPNLEVILDSIFLTCYIQPTSGSYHFCLPIHPRSDRFLPPQSPSSWPKLASPHWQF